MEVRSPFVIHGLEFYFISFLVILRNGACLSNTAIKVLFKHFTSLSTLDVLESNVSVNNWEFRSNKMFSRLKIFVRLVNFLSVLDKSLLLPRIKKRIKNGPKYHKYTHHFKFLVYLY